MREYLMREGLYERLARLVCDVASSSRAMGWKTWRM